MRLCNFGKNMRRTQSSLWVTDFLHQCSWHVHWKCQTAAAKAWKAPVGKNKRSRSSQQHCSISLVPVWGQSQTSSRALSPPASQDQTQGPAPVPVPAPVSCSQAQTGRAQRGEAPSSTWERRPPRFFSVLPLCNPVHVKSAPAPQGGGWTRLWGDHCLLPPLLCFLSAVLSFFFLFLLFLNALAAGSQNRPQSECWLHTMHWLYT